MKVGTVALIGRPNTGKSTLVNNLVGHKVAITSPKPQTTQFPIYAVYEDERGQIVFVDTPGIFAKLPSGTGNAANFEAERVLREDVDVLLYIIDLTRQRGKEENKVLGIVRKLSIPKILVINKTDILQPNYHEQYRFMEEEFDQVIEVSALKGKNLSGLLSVIFSYLKEGEKFVVREDLPVPALNLSSKLYIEELIREKAFLTLRKELPYKISVVVDEIQERDNGAMYVRGRIITLSMAHRRMVIGEGAARVKQIGMMARKELEVATGKKVFLELTVETE
jgi:GTP-binding protein Era